MQPLQRFEDEMYRWSLQGERWIYVPRVDGVMFGLAIVTVGRTGAIDVPLESCWATSLRAITRHAAELNARHLRTRSRNSAVLPATVDLERNDPEQGSAA